MAERRVGRRFGRRAARAADALSRRAYTLEPTKPLALRITLRVSACALSAVLGAASLAGWQAQRGGAASPCVPDPVAEKQRQAELERARLALAEESAARAAVQKTADRAAAEVARLSADLQFLRAQGGRRRPAASP